MCRATNHFTWDCPHQEAFLVWHKEHLNSKGAGPQSKEPTPKKPPMEASMLVATTCCTSSLITDGPTAHWVGPETLVGLQVEGREDDALADSGSQVNTVTPGYVHQHESLCCHCMTLSITPSTWLGWVVRGLAHLVL